MKDLTQPDKKWLQLMQIGRKTGCHQLPERSFFYRNYQFPVCARCLGVLIGYIIGTITFILFGFQKKISIVGMMLMFLDWYFQKLHIKESTNFRRVVTGFMGGYGLIHFYWDILKKLFTILKKH